MAGCVGVAGSAIFGKNCTVGGAAMIGGHLTIADRTHITASSVVQSSVTEPGVIPVFIHWQSIRSGKRLLCWCVNWALCVIESVNWKKL